MQSRAWCATHALAALVLISACDAGSTSAGDVAGGSSAAGSPAVGGAPGNAGSPSNGGAGSQNDPQAGAPGMSQDGTIVAKTAVAAMGNGFNLGQMFESTQHPPTLAAASAKIDAYYAKGFRVVRVPVTWTEVTNGDTLVGDPAVGDVNRTHPRLLVIEQVVDYALSKPGMYVVLNAHHEEALKTQSRAAVLERLWADIADIFAERDHRLVFEILNEPHRTDSSAMPAADLRNMTAKAYAKIRAVDPARLIVIGGNQWFAAAEVPAVWTDLSGVGGGNDPYLMATFHHYDPWTFCGDNQGTYADAWTEANISAPMDKMLNWANSVGKGMPVFIGEWGVGWGSRYDSFSCNNIRSWYQKLPSAFASKRGIATMVWDDGGWFMIYDHASNAFANNLVDCISGTCDWEGTERFNTGCQ
ncbi:MAG TPA: cellulase family glycosylhydrolase [Polyangiaceae bacterium]|nr:cellulase family glycosylhydrolase [Polyangiaceae bacterium]